MSRSALLGIPDTALTGMRPSTEPYALLLARSIRVRLNATWGLGETGAAGPTGNRYGDAAGHACIAFAGAAEAALTIETGSADRAQNMRAFAAGALELLTRQLKG
jgi:nicotinamide-nucleotide amidase